MMIYAPDKTSFLHTYTKRLISPPYVSTPHRTALNLLSRASLLTLHMLWALHVTSGFLVRLLASSNNAHLTVESQLTYMHEYPAFAAFSRQVPVSQRDTSYIKD